MADKRPRLDAVEGRVASGISEGKKAAALKAIVRFLEDLRLSDAAEQIRSEGEKGEAVNKLIASLSSNHGTSPGMNDTLTAVHTPAAAWSTDDVEKSAVPMVEDMLQADVYLARSLIKEISNQFIHTAAPAKTVSPWEPKTYPRYRAPAGRGRPSAMTSNSPDKQLDLAYRIGEPTSPVFGALSNVEERPRSEEYCPKGSRPKEESPFDPTDQYRDDDDPGYRIRDLWESDLIEEIQARERGDPEALKIPYFAAFVCGNAKAATLRSYPQYDGTSTAADMGTADSSAPTLAGISTQVQDVRPLAGEGYVLNSTPPRGSASSRGGLSGFGTAASDAPSQSVSEGGGSRRCGSPTFGSPAGSAVVDEDDELSGARVSSDIGFPEQPANSMGGNSAYIPSFESPVNPVGSIDTSTPPIQNTVSVENILGPQSLSSLLPPEGPIKPTTESPSFGVQPSSVPQVKEPPAQISSSDELALCISVVPTASPPVMTQDIAVVDNPGPLPEVLATSTLGLLRTTFPGMDESMEALAAEQWRQAYSDGNSELHRKKKTHEKIAKSASVMYPESEDPDFPLIDDNNKMLDCFNLKVIYERDKTGFEEFKDFQVTVGSVIAGRYVVESQLGQAAFSKALRCYDKKLKCHVCMKVIRNDKDYVDQSLDEIKLLRYINANGDVDLTRCLRLYEFFYYREHLIIVTEILRENLYDFSRKHREKGKNYFTIGRIQRVAAQILIALRYVHSLRLIHSDLKPENVLVKCPATCEVKVIDFGSSCFEDDLLSLYVQSRSYRAPEVLLGLPYDQKIDLWSLGCILAELWTGYVLFQNDSAAALLARVVGILGQLPYYMVCRGQTVSEHFTQDGQLFKVKTDEPACPRRGKRIRILLPKPSNLKQRLRTNDSLFIDFVSLLLQVDPSKRLSATEALEHPWLQPGRYSDGL